MVRVRDVRTSMLITETDTKDKAMKFIDDEGFVVIKERYTPNNDIIIIVS